MIATVTDLWILFGAFPLAGYLVGSIPFGVLIGRLNGIDLRKVGSGNVGATNVTRVLGKKWGYPCFLLDVAKGALPPIIGGLLIHGPGTGVPSTIQQVAWLSSACGAILGHVFNPWLKFRGGKGVATALGATLGLYPYLTLAGLCAFTTWIVVTLVSRYVSVGSIVAAVAFIPFMVALNWNCVGQLWPLIIFASTMMSLIVVRHLGNIKRLLAGTENKIGQGKKA